MATCMVGGRPVPDALLGELRDSSELLSTSEELRSRMAEDSYVFLRGALDAGEIMAAREEVLERLAEVDEIKRPAVEGWATGTSRRKELGGDLGEFWQSVSEGPNLRTATHGAKMRSILDALFGEPSIGQDYVFLRVGVPGRSTDLHYDYPFFARGSERIVTVWFPVGEVSVVQGPLMIVEGSHHYSDLIDLNQTLNYDSTASPRVALEDDAITFAQKRGTRLLTTHFQPGDIVVFGMTTLHGSLDNHSPENRVRVSVDVRYQPASDPKDERYFGAKPGGTTGVGYGELNGAKPLDQPWHVR